MRWANSLQLAPWLMIIIGPTAWGTISPDSVLVIYNPAWSDGTHDGSYIADYYANARGIPLSNVVGLTGLGTSEDISATDYLNVIRPQVESALQTRNISTIVTTKGLPLRITIDMSNPIDPNVWEYHYTDALGIQRTTYYDYWQPYSSLESELTRINTIGLQNGIDWMTTAKTQMGDQLYWNPSDDGTSPNPSNNPYYLSTTAFNHNDPAMGGMYLTARLDGYTISNVTAAINKAKNAYLLPNSSLKSSWIVMDDDPNADIGDQVMVQQLKNTLPSGQKSVYDPTSNPVTTVQGPVIGYDSHGVHGGGFQTGYIINNLNFTLANGAVFQTHESYNAYTFNGQPGQNPMGQGLVADWLSIGGTAGVGNIAEPGNGIANEANEDQMFKMLLNGYNWGEAAWSSLQQLSYVNTVVGDPLMTWKQVLSGDANKDGYIGLLDVAALASSWSTGHSGTHTWEEGDFNGDGNVDLLDVAMLAANWGHYAPWAQLYSGGSDPPIATNGFDEEAILALIEDIPEPSTIVSAVAGLFTLIAAYILRRLRRP